MKNNKIKKINT